MHHKTMTKIQILVRKMRTLSLKSCASEGSNERPQTIASGWTNTNQNIVQGKHLKVYFAYKKREIWVNILLLADNLGSTICL